MNFEELDYLVNKQKKIKRSTKVSMKTVDDSGSSHPLWDCLHMESQMYVAWKGLTGAQRGQLVRAAKKLHEVDIPYSFYTAFLQKMGKLSLLRVSPMMISKYKPKKSGTPTILSEYIDMMKYLIEVFKQNPEVIRLNDHIYKALPGSYRHGTLKYIHTVRTIEEALGTHTRNEILQVLNNCNDIKDFWNALGKSTSDNPVKGDIDLSAGCSTSDVVKILQREIRIRLGKEHGEPSEKLNKYFNKNNRLNVQGLKVVSGERGL